MNKKHCKIVFDLLPGYIENDVTDETKEFIEEHLKECENCQEMLKNMKSDIIGEQEKIEDNSKIEIEKIKKVKRRFKTHKIILTLSSIIVLIVAIVLVSNTIYHQLNKTLYDRIEEVYQENRKLNNYRFIYKYTYIVYNETGSFTVTEDAYYKDGNFKVYEYGEFKDSGKKTTQVQYGKMGANEITLLDIDNKTFKDDVTHAGYSGTETIFDGTPYFLELERFKDKDYEDMEIKNIDGKEWYFYKKGTENHYVEYWINKDNLTDLRYIEVDPKYYREESFILEKSVVTDEDMKIEYDTTDYERTMK